ncbi:DUF1573 domain-containing protein [Aquimarina gracilis]|uniref:DUF1573 domain-containing protein n=1 Tax=Aquimarina gracilis TaxID=874422 RepID=A0ABU5ZTV3_9FLAO|nr:DUF1573 domain-containing protein [Aquimarina gracilis]MEB3345506.1 DUF1573 domain-containing protein [Aquimarina gracilis]
MKKEILMILSTVLFMTTLSCTQKAVEKVKPENVAIAAKHDTKATKLPIMSFSETTYNFGTINEGDVVEHEFLFKNTGEAPLVIISAKGSCGCTVPKWSTEPIQPGESGSLLVRFNSSGKPNMQTKQITITTNTEKGKEILKVKANVTPKSSIGS